MGGLAASVYALCKTFSPKACLNTLKMPVYHILFIPLTLPPLTWSMSHISLAGSCCW